MIFEFASQVVNDSVKKLKNIMESDQTNGPYGGKELKLTICRLNSKRLEDYLEQKDNCNSALTLRYFLLWLELDELKKQNSNCHVFLRKKSQMKMSSGFLGYHSKDGTNPIFKRNHH